MKADILKKRIRRLTLVFVVFLVMSGVTAFPLHWELGLLNDWWGSGDGWLAGWIRKVYEGVDFTSQHYPYLHYGTDWLAFAHIVIASAFIGVWRDPVRNRWVIEWAMLACLMVFPLAFIMGPIRGIPFVWQLIDCSFGLLGLLPLFYLRRLTLNLEALSTPKTQLA